MPEVVPVRRDLVVDPTERERESSEVVALVGPHGDGPDPQIGRTIAGYVLERKIGQGGMGVVYQGRQVSLDRVVAIKILSKALSDNGEFIKRFQREARSIARINHPNIVAVYDFGSHLGEWFMVNEYIEGSSLASRIGERLVVPVSEFVPLMVHCLAGLAHVESTNIVHRDIKPDNILITRDGIAKIADFGLAKDVNEREDREQTDLTATGLAMGTPAYMSPEQCMGRKLDGRSDQYALGVTAYYALTGEKPFTGNSSFEVMTKQREHVPPAPHQLNPSLSAEISELIVRMLAKDPSDRFPDAETCRQAWLSAGENLGMFGNKTRSGEYDALGLRGTSGRIRTPVVALPDPLPMVVPEAPPVPVRRPSERLRTPVASPVVRPTSETINRPVSSSPAATSSVGATATAVDKLRTPTAGATCPRCGMLNRADAQHCGRCSSPLRDDPAHTHRDQAAAAERLIDQGRHREAAAVYARLADQESDRRVRSILRAKEREARKVDDDRQATEFLTRARGLVERGDLRGALSLLEQGSRLGGDAAPGSSTMGVLEQEAQTVRRRLVRQSRLRVVMAILAVAVALAAAVWWGISTAKVPSPTAPGAVR